jgi:TfoX/Sxy family transcriptional regulator of competence genes
MEIPRAAEADKEYLRSLVPDDPEVEFKPMFGNLGAFVHGNMFAGLYGDAVGVKLSEADRAELAGAAGAGPYGPAERPMGGYLSLPAAWRDSPELAAEWVGRAFAYAGSLPPKKAKAARPRNAG